MTALDIELHHGPRTNANTSTARTRPLAAGVIPATIGT
jgi:hypothetical protein